MKPEVDATLYSVNIENLMERWNEKSDQLPMPLDSTGFSKGLISDRNFNSFLDDDQSGATHFNISPAPKSTHISQRTNKEMSSYAVNPNLLQVTVNDRALILDLSKD